jgi:hypothetical protein
MHKVLIISTALLSFGFVAVGTGHAQTSPTTGRPTGDTAVPGREGTTSELSRRQLGNGETNPGATTNTTTRPQYNTGGPATTNETAPIGGATSNYDKDKR